MNDVLVVIPTYNEAQNLAGIVARLRASGTDADVLIVDDNSPDGTGALADRLSAESVAAASRVHVLHRPLKQGLGAAYLAGFAWGLARDYTVLVEMDADGSHRPEQLPELLAALERGADLALGSRWVPGGAVINWSRRRQWLSRAGNAYARVMLGVPIRDATGGFRAYRSTTLARLDLHEVASQGYCFQVDLAVRTHRQGLSIVEVPITFLERAHGNSKMSRAIVFEALWRVTAWGVARRLRRVKA